VTPVGSERAIIVIYAVLGLLLAGLFSRLSSTAEANQNAGSRATLKITLGIGASRAVVLKLSGLLLSTLLGAASWFKALPRIGSIFVSA
jgi:hypothetical protein